MSVVGFVHGVRDWPHFPPLRALATAPVLTPEGRILAQAGYDVGTGIVCAGEPFDVPDTAPTAADLEAARTLILDDLLADLSFVNPASKADAVAYAVLPFVRHAIPWG